MAIETDERTAVPVRFFMRVADNDLGAIGAGHIIDAAGPAEANHQVASMLREMADEFEALDGGLTWDAFRWTPEGEA